jgi:hypothetical protein
MFLTNPRHVFVGVRVAQDVRYLFQDYNVDTLTLQNHVKTVDLARFAKRRDVVQNATASLSELCRLVLCQGT